MKIFLLSLFPSLTSSDHFILVITVVVVVANNSEEDAGPNIIVSEYHSLI